MAHTHTRNFGIGHGAAAAFHTPEQPSPRRADADFSLTLASRRADRRERFLVLGVVISMLAFVAITNWLVR